MNLTQHRGRLVALAAALAALATASPAAADVTTCSLSNGVLDVKLHGDTSIEVAGDRIRLRSGGVVNCNGGPPTLSTVDGLRIQDLTDNPATATPRDGDVTLTLTDPNALHGGRSAEPPGQISEVELYVDLGLGDDRLVALASREFGGRWAAGEDGINWNQDDDADLSGDLFDHITFVGSPYADRLSARGGLNLGRPLYLSRTTLDGREGDDQLLGGDNADSLDPGSGVNTVSGFGGGDAILDRGGDDSISGGVSVDRLVFAVPNGPARLDLRRTDRQDTGSGADVVTGIEEVFGTAGDDTFTGTAGREYFHGHRGDDVFAGGGGDDALDGGEGTDTASYADVSEPIRGDLAAGRVVVGTQVGTVQQIENLVGSPFADVLAGNGEANVLTGGPGEDRLAGEGGADRIEARDGNADAVTCGAGAPDTVIGDRRSLDTVAADCEAADLLPEPPSAAPAGGQEPSRSAGGAAADPQTPRPDADGTLTFRLAGARTQRVARTGRIAVRVACPAEPCTATVGAGGTLRRLTLTPVTRAVRAGTARTVSLRLSRAQRQAVRRALAQRRRVRLTVRAVARDAAGNRATRTLRVAVAR